MAIQTDAIEALGGFQCLANKETLTATILTKFPTATITKIKTKA